MSSKTVIALVLVLLIFVVGSSSLYIVDESERAIRLKFGELVESDIQPGLHLKWPIIDNVRFFDVRVLTLDSPRRQYLTIEQKPVVVDSYVTWRISDVAKFYTSASGQETRAVSLLSSRVDNGLRDQFGVRTMHEVVSGERDEMMSQLTTAMNQFTLKEFGIEVLDIRIKAIDLPDTVSENVFRRMRTERQKEAQEHRSKGKELAEGVMADADRQRIVIEAEAFKEAERTRGEGDEQAASIYADAYGQDPEFYSFTRSLKAYEESFANKGDLLVIDPNSEFFKYLNDLKAGQ